MITTSYHTHNRFCDGTGEIQEYADAAIASGLEALGITSHSPLTFPDKSAMRAEDLPAYCAEIRRVKDTVAGRLRAHLGLEFDYIPERQTELWRLIEPYPFDYLIGSVHFVTASDNDVPMPIDLTRQDFETILRQLCGGDIRRLVGSYYERVRSMVEWSAGRVAVLGHIDRIKKWNADSVYFREDEPWYKREIEAALQACRRAGFIVEINTVGYRHPVGNVYTSPWIARRCVELGIPLIVTCDAHTPERVTDFHIQAEGVLRQIGCTSLAVLRDNGWQVEPHSPEA